MKTKYIIITTILILACVIVACDDYLEVPVNGTTSPEDFYNTDADVNSALVSAYDILTWNNNNWGWCAPVFVKTLPSDEGTCGGETAGDQPDYNSIDKYSYDSGNIKIEGFWSLAYYGINRCNQLINNVTIDSDFKRQAIAEAKALRAYNYLEIAAFFGGGPIMLEEPEQGDYDRSRATLSEVYAQIDLDLTEAIPDLQTKSQQSDADKFRVSQGTAITLLGKSKLYQAKYSEALTEFNKVIDSGEYELAEDFASIFTREGEFGSGSLFEAVFTSEVGYNWGTNPWDAGTGERSWESNMHIQLMGIRDAGNATDIGLNGGWGFNQPTAKLAAAFDASGDIERKSATLIDEEAWIAGGGDELPIDSLSGESALFDYQGFIRIKYGPLISESGDPSIEQNFGTNWRLLRYADVLLMAAEAAAFSGDEGTAHQYLNMVRNRAGLEAIAPSGDLLIQAIQNERQLELAFEGFRYIDLIRWRIAENELGNLGFSSKHNLFPIPANELLRSPSLIQNPGW